MMIWTKDVYPLGPYRLLLKLSTGEQYTLDCSELLQIPLFARIRDPAFFSTVHTDETGLICWDNATDIEPGWLSANLEPSGHPGSPGAGKAPGIRPGRFSR